MEELVKLVAQKVGISEEMAQEAVDTVMGFLKQKLPEPFGSQIEAFLSGGGLDQADDIVEQLGGLLGGLGG